MQIKTNQELLVRLETDFYKFMEMNEKEEIWNKLIDEEDDDIGDYDDIDYFKLKYIEVMIETRDIEYRDYGLETDLYCVKMIRDLGSLDDRTYFMYDERDMLNTKIGIQDLESESTFKNFILKKVQLVKPTQVTKIEWRAL
jgi:hypothetical protein